MFFLSIQPFMRPLFSIQQELSNLDNYFQDGDKKRVHKQIKFLKIKKHMLIV